MIRSMRRLVPLLAAAVLAGCQDEVPLVVGPALSPVDPLTFEVILPWSEFASEARVFGGFGRASETGRGVLAHEFAGTLEARTLVRLQPFPDVVEVLDSLGTVLPDTAVAFFSASLIVTFDTTSHTNTGPVLLEVGRIAQEWDPRTATWELAVDSVGHQVPWAEPGAGPVIPLRESFWLPDTGAEAFFGLDSATVALLGDTTRTDRDLRISLSTAGERLDVESVRIQLHGRPSINQDTTLFLDVGARNLTFIYTPEPPPPGDELRVAGVPAWRSVVTLDLPQSVAGTPAVCARVSCPIPLTAADINHAGILLTTTASPPAFILTDTLPVDVRAVLAPELLPKSPIGSPLFVDTLGSPVGTPVPPQTGTPVGIELPVTPIVRSLLANVSLGGFRPTPSIALIELIEPRTFGFASFVGPGHPGEPRLRLVITVSQPVTLP